MSHTLRLTQTARPMQRFRRGHTVLIVSLLLVGLVAVASLVLFVQSETTTRATAGADLHTVEYDTFDITIPTSGELEALNRVEVRNKMESRAVITDIVEEGVTVEEGDVLLRLADEEIRDRIKDAEEALRSAQNEHASARANLEIAMSTRDSELAQADLEIRLAELALDAWRDGELLSKQRQLELDIETAEMNYNRLVDRVEQSRRLAEEGFISEDEYERDRISMIEAQATLEQARIAKEVYEDYTYHQEHAQFHSDLEQAKDERERTEQRHRNEVERARADVESKEFQLESRQQRLADLRQQLEHSVVRAPTAGLVVYASSMQSRRRRSPDPPDIGTELSPNEEVIILPDISQLVANVQVNEALSGLVQRGQRATVMSDAVPGEMIEGEVMNIGVLAQSGGWRDPNRRDYTVRIKLDRGAELGLKPSMRAQATIYIDTVEEALSVPLQSVFREGDVAYVYLRNGSNEYEQRPVRVGRTSETKAEILGGIDEGDVVLLREPRSNEIVRRLDRMPTDDRYRLPDEEDDDPVGLPAT